MYAYLFLPVARFKDIILRRKDATHLEKRGKTQRDLLTLTHKLPTISVRVCVIV